MYHNTKKLFAIMMVAMCLLLNTASMALAQEEEPTLDESIDESVDMLFGMMGPLIKLIVAAAIIGIIIAVVQGIRKEASGIR